MGGTLLTQTMSSRQNAILLSYNTVFFHPSEISTSQYLAMLSKFSFPKNGKKVKSKFRMEYLCNGGAGDLQSNLLKRTPL